MSKKCYYCGYDYPDEELNCPICGQTKTVEVSADEPKEEPMRESKEKPAEKPPVKKTPTPIFDDDDEDEPPVRPSRGSGIVSTILCIVLAAAVVVGALFILKSLGVFGGKTEPKTSELPQSSQTTAETTGTACTNLTISPLNMSFTEAGQKTVLTILPEPENCTDQIAIASADPNVATVNSTGEVIAVAEGTTTITVACGAYSCTANVVCDFLSTGETTATATEPAAEDKPTVAIDASALKLNREDFTLNDTYPTWTLKLSGLPTGVEVTWTSDDPTVATVDKDGKVTAIATGTTEVHATVQDTTLDCVVRVSLKNAKKADAATTTTTAAASDIKISHEDVTLKNGESFKISLKSGDTKQSGVSWQSKNAAVCTVSADGTVQAVASGTTEITGTLNGTTYTCIVRCR